MSEITPAGAQQQARTDRSEREDNRVEQAKSSRQERAARTDRQQEARAQERSEQMCRQESAHAAQRAEDNRGQNLQAEQEQGRGQAVDTIA